MSKQGFGKLASLPEAFRLIDSLIKPLGTEKVALEECNGRVLAQDIAAAIDVPHFRRSAMDGFAVIAKDTFNASNTKPLKLKVIASVTAGQMPPKDIRTGECIQITTGAMLPKSADAVLMVEYTETVGSMVSVYKSCAPGDNIIKIGSDIRAGTTVFSAGTRLNPRCLGVLAALGIREAAVKKKPKIAYFSTGNEVIESGQLAEGKVFDINSLTVIQTLRAYGCAVHGLGIVPDSKDAIKKAILAKIDTADIVILSGGSSLGSEDYMVEAIAELGKVHIHGIAVKPGKPTLVGVVKGKLVIGLPGHPTSALTNTYIFITPILDKMLGTTSNIIKVKARLSRKIVSTIGRYDYLPVRLRDDVAEPVLKGSSAITTLADADGYICIDEYTEVLEKDTEVEVNLFA